MECGAIPTPVPVGKLRLSQISLQPRARHTCEELQAEHPLCIAQAPIFFPHFILLLTLLMQTASVNVDCRKADWLECFISCITGCHTPTRVVKEDEEGSRSEPHGIPKHNSELCSRIAHYSSAQNRHFWRDTTDTLSGSSQDGDWPIHSHIYVMTY